MINHSQPFITPKLNSKIGNLIKRKDFVSGQIEERVKKMFRDKFNQRNIYFLQSGTQALYAILKGLNLSEGDEVILPTYACSTIYNAVVNAGCKPVLCDSKYWHVTPELVKSKISNKTKVILLVSLYGMYLDCAEFRFPGVTIINDLCQSFDILRSKHRDYGDFIIYSFHPTKFINAGGGGAVSICDESIQFNKNFINNSLNLYLSNLNLLVLEEQLIYYENIIKKRQRIAEYYKSKISPRFTKYINEANNSFFRFPLVQDKYDFDDVQARFYENNILVKRGVDSLIHRIIGESDELYPNAVKAFRTTISIPIYPSLKWKDVKLIGKIAGRLFNE